MQGGSHRPTNLPWVMNNEANAEDVSAVGGEIRKCIAGTTLNIGDYVYLMNTAPMRVSKSATAANYARVRIGVVVGGHKTYGQVVQDDGMIGQPAADAEEGVLVCTSGLCKAIAGAAIAGITNTLGPDTSVAGRVVANNTATQNLGLSQSLQPTIGLPVLVYVIPS